MNETTYIKEEEIISPQVPSKKTMLEIVSGIVSYVFSPFIIPLAAFLWLFSCTYLSMMPFLYRLFSIGMVGCFTMLMPILFIYLYLRINRWPWKELGDRKKRFIPYLLTVMGYVTCLVIMNRMNFPRYMSNIITVCLLCMILCALLNFKWKISIHAASSGLLIGSLLVYSLIFHFNPVGWLCGLILQSGIVCTARMILNQHTLSEVTAGFVAGMFCGIAGILFI